LNRRSFFLAPVGLIAGNSHPNNKGIESDPRYSTIRFLLNDLLPGGMVFTNEYLCPYLNRAIYNGAKDACVGAAALAAWSKGLLSLGDRYACVAWPNTSVRRMKELTI
jgi:hypothetical protein